jgi:hypothetical protein
MSLQAFIFLPDSDEEILKIGDQESDFQQAIQSAVLLLEKLHQQQDIVIFYDEENIKIFLQRCKTIIHETYLQKPENLLRIKLRKTARNLQSREHTRKQSDCLYLCWRIEDVSVIYANTMLSEIAERMFTHPNESYLLLNIGNALPSDRAFLTIFKDAKHVRMLPDRFACIPFVIDQEELELWLATNHQSTFSLLDRNRFRRTTIVQQGKPVFEELNTGYFWYLDNLHKTEYEVFNPQRQHIGVADLQGQISQAKKVAGRTF